MTMDLKPDEEMVPLDISCHATDPIALWAELTLHSQVYAVPGPWQVRVARYYADGYSAVLNYTTSDQPAPQNIGPGSYREALAIRTCADFLDPAWTGATGELFTARIWKNAP